MKIDIERVAVMKADAEHYLDELEAIGVNSREDLKNRTKYYAASMLLFSIINRTIDLGEELLKVEEIKKMALSYREVFNLLQKNGTISGDLHSKIDKLVKTRNCLAHEYERFDDLDIYSVYEGMSAIREFLDIVDKKVKESLNG